MEVEICVQVEESQSRCWGDLGLGCDQHYGIEQQAWVHMAPKKILELYHIVVHQALCQVWSGVAQWSLYWAPPEPEAGAEAEAEGQRGHPTLVPGIDSRLDGVPVEVWELSWD